MGNCSDKPVHGVDKYGQEAAKVPGGPGEQREEGEEEEEQEEPALFGRAPLEGALLGLARCALCCRRVHSTTSLTC